MYRLPAFCPFWSLPQPKELSVNAILKERIGERVGALKISWRRASLEAGLEAGFIQDVITGRSQHPSGDALASLAAALKCSPAYLTGQSDDLAGDAVAQGITAGSSDAAQRPDAVMALRIIDELLAAGHVEAARVAVRRALKSIAID
jgi:hypothetical protein